MKQSSWSATHIWVALLGVVSVFAPIHACGDEPVLATPDGEIRIDYDPGVTIARGNVLCGSAGATPGFVSGVNWAWRPAALDGPWTIGPTLQPIPPGFPFGVKAYEPVEACGLPSGDTYLFTNNGPILCYRSPASDSAFHFLPPLVCLNRTPTGDGFDRPSAACDLTGQHVYVAATSSRRVGAGVTATYPYYVVLTRSHDRGLTWSPPDTLSGSKCNGASVAVGPDGEVYVAWVDYAQSAVLCRKSLDRGVTFGPPITIGTMFDNSASPTWGLLRPSWLVDFRRNPQYPLLGTLIMPNFPVIAVDRSPGATRGRVHVVWAERLANTPPPPSQTTDEVEPNNTIETAQPIAFGTRLVGSAPGFFPDLGSDSDTDWFQIDGVLGQTVQIKASLIGSGPDAPLSLFIGTAPGQVRTLSVQRFGVQGSGMPPMVYTLPRTGTYYFATISQTNRAITYQMDVDALPPDPAQAARDHRDIVMTTSVDGGATWRPRVRVNDDLPYYENGMPNLAVDDQGKVYVAWFDRRGYPGGDSLDVYAAISPDGGVTFLPNQRLTSAANLWREGNTVPPFGGQAGGFVGDRPAIAAGENYAFVAWTDFRNVDPDIYGALLQDLPTPVLAVSDLFAEPSEDRIRLSWLVHDRHDLLSMQLYRKRGEGDELPIGGLRTPNQIGPQAFDDADVSPGDVLHYRLRVTTRSGELWLGPVTATLAGTPARLALRTTGANPFRGSAALELAMPRQAEAEVEILDVTGKRVRTLQRGALAPGRHALRWDGRDAQGGTAAPGVYFVAARLAGESVHAKLVRME